VDGVVVRIHLARARGIVGWTQVRAVHAGIGAVLGDVLGERLRGAVVRAVAAVRGERANGHVREPLLDEMHVEGAARRRHAEIAVSERAVHRAVLGRRAAIGIEDGDEPEDAEVLEPRRTFDERTQIEAVVAWRQRGLDRELEPRDLTRTDVRSRLHGDAVVARPTCRERSCGAVTAERTDLILSRLGAPRSEIRDLAEAAAHPSE